MEKSISTRTILKKMLPWLLVGFLVLIALTFVGDIRQILTLAQSFPWQVLPIMMGFTLINYILRFVKWHFYLGQIGVKKFPKLQSLRLFVAGFPLAMTPGKAGEVLKAVWLKEMTGVPVSRGVSVILAERISDGLAVLFLSTFGVFAYPQYAPAFILVLVLLVSLIIISQIKPLAYWFLNISKKIPVIKKFSPILIEFYEGSFIVFRPGATILAVSLGMVSWLAEGIGFYYLLTVLGLPANQETFANAVFILAFSTVIAAVSTLPGGLGAAEASIAGMLTILVGMTSTNATFATLIIRLATLWFGISLGLLTWLFSMEILGFKEYQYAKVEN
ncbi:MAG: lysylphosphatidylglycerol synthase transmembrane domain-containing protein [Anaerolineaceae bacterium]|nr:lysylphosphatidylglycerol synthase transmembrane domain-containing protein [Anaerolineaceae bacterium]